MKHIVAALAAMLVLAPGAALAQIAPDDVLEDVLEQGFYVEPGIGTDVDSIADSVMQGRNAGSIFMVVLLDDDPTGGATAFADALLDEVEEGTILVLSATGEGLVSTEYTTGDLDDALDAGFTASSDAPIGAGDEAFVAAVADLLFGNAPVDEPASSGGGGGGSGLIILLVIVAVLVLLVWFAIRRSKKASAARRGTLIGEARAEIRSQLDAMANTILEITDMVGASSPSQDDTYLRAASATFSEADDAFAAANDLKSLEDLSDRLDEARWQLGAAAAIARGEEVPEEPDRQERHVCFFDPTHPYATETAELKTAAGTQMVRVCPEDAEKLRRGSTPDPRMIEVNGRRVPAPMAPKSHGGGGFDWLGTFSVLAGGVGQAASYDWGRSRQAAATRSTATRRAPTPATPGRRRKSSKTRSRTGRTRRRNR